MARISPAKADTIFKQLDSNGDGILTRDEYMKARLQSFDEAQEEARAQPEMPSRFGFFT
jgi:hypothetical protein